MELPKGESAKPGFRDHAGHISLHSTLNLGVIEGAVYSHQHGIPDKHSGNY